MTPRLATPPIDDPACGAEGGAGGEADFRALFRTNLNHVWRSLRALGVEDADLGDASQQVFLVLHGGLARWNRECSLRAFMYGICLRVASDHRRKAHRRRERLFASPPDVSSGDPSPEDTAVNRQELRFLDDELAKLAPAQREVFVLFEVEELDMRDVADAVGCPLFTAYSRLRAARKAVTRGLDERRRR